MKNMALIKIRLGEEEKLQKISRQTFHETFADQNSVENMKRYLEEGFSLEKLREEIQDPRSAFYFVTEGNEPMGYLKLNLANAQTELQELGGMEIERIYVLKSEQGKGFGNLLFNKALEIAVANGATYIWLGVWEKNLPAIEFYKKKGMEVFDSHVFRLGDEEQLDYLMRRPVRLPTES